MHGIDLSPDMVARLQAKPGGEDNGVTIGDFATASAGGTFRLAYLLYNTIENLASQDDQVACFGNVARHLEPGRCFVVEVEVPKSGGCRRGRRLPHHVSPQRLGFDSSTGPPARVPTTTGSRVTGRRSTCPSVGYGPPSST